MPDASIAAAPETARGMSDLLPAEMERLRAAERAFIDTCRAWGYREVRTPAIEPLYLFTAAGTLSPQTLERVYSFFDWDGWSGERVVLRPDSTIPVARLYVRHLAADGPAKLYYSQDVFRFTDDGSARAEWQCGVELLGDCGPASDLELILLAREALARAGVGDLTLRLSHAEIARRVLAAAGLASDEQARAYDRLLDGDATVLEEIEARLPELDTPLHLLFDVEGSGGAYLRNIQEALAPAIPGLADVLDELATVVAPLEQLGVQPRIQAALARRFEYYSGVVFRIDAGDRRVAAGGRYDRLLGLIGGRDVPASGFAVYLGAIAAVSTPSAAATAPRLRVLIDGGARAAVRAHELARALRSRGRVVETSCSGDAGDTLVRVGDDAFIVRTRGDEQRCPDVPSAMAALDEV
jgi:histidyl-tRNA synthetase